MYFDGQFPVQLHVGTRREVLHDLFIREHMFGQCGEQVGGNSNRSRDDG